MGNTPCKPVAHFARMLVNDLDTSKGAGREGMEQAGWRDRAAEKGSLLTHTKGYLMTPGLWGWSGFCMFAHLLEKRCIFHTKYSA